MQVVPAICVPNLLMYAITSCKCKIFLKINDLSYFTLIFALFVLFLHHYWVINHHCSIFALSWPILPTYWALNHFREPYKMYCILFRYPTHLGSVDMKLQHTMNMNFLKTDNYIFSRNYLYRTRPWYVKILILRLCSGYSPFTNQASPTYFWY